MRKGTQSGDRRLGSKDKKLKYGLKYAVNLCENAVRKRTILYGQYTLRQILRKKKTLRMQLQQQTTKYSLSSQMFITEKLGDLETPVVKIG